MKIINKIKKIQTRMWELPTDRDIKELIEIINKNNLFASAYMEKEVKRGDEPYFGVVYLRLAGKVYPFPAYKPVDGSFSHDGSFLVEYSPLINVCSVITDEKTDEKLPAKKIAEGYY
jgi:hypothetical protein